MKKKIIKVICFLLIFVFLFLGFNRVFNFKDGDGIYSLTKFYEQPRDSVDVMFFGSSHVFENVNTAVLYDEYGIASYDLCGSIQPFWNTYYYMKEALKTQTPSVMVVDVYAAIQTEDYIDHSRIIKNNYGLKLSKDKVASVTVSSPPEQHLDYLLEYPTYHSRYTDLTKADFAENKGQKLYENWKGFGLNTATTSYAEPVSFYTEETTELCNKVNEYLLKIISLSQEESIPLLLIKSPYLIQQSHQRIYNQVAEIAAEHNIPFVNYNLQYDEMDLDFSTDFADSSHLNHLGNVKFTRYLAEYLKSNYAIPDRRGDAEYSSYDQMVKYYKQQLYNFEQTEIVDIGTYIDSAQNENYITVYSISGDYKSMENYEAVKNKLQTIGINLDDVNSNAVWVMKNGETLFSGTEENSFSWHLPVSEYDNLMVSFENGVSEGIEINLSNTIYKAVDEGLNMLIYDTETETIVESVGFPLSGGRLIYSKTV